MTHCGSCNFVEISYKNMAKKIFSKEFLNTPSRQRTFLTFSAFVVFLAVFALLLNYTIFPLMIHAGKEVTVPALVGKNVKKASAELQELGLNIQEVREVFSDKVAEGIVLNQNPLPNSVVKEGRRLYLTVSKGKEGGAMPNLNGKSLREARIILMESGLELGIVQYEFSETVLRDRIMAQSIQYGAKIGVGDMVSLTISKGNENYAVPNLVGMTQVEAEEAIVTAGFILGGIVKEKNETYLSGTVIAQVPSAGESSSKETPINLTVSE